MQLTNLEKTIILIALEDYNNTEARLEVQQEVTRLIKAFEKNII